MTRAYSASNLKSATKPHRMMSRHNTLQLENISTSDGGDSLAAFIFPKNTSNSNQTSPTRNATAAKKNKKVDSHKIEELQTSYDALKTHLKAAIDDIERLKYENNQLRLQREANMTEEQDESSVLSSSDDEDPETELEATL
jgi:hypothetical protein